MRQSKSRKPLHQVTVLVKHLRRRQFVHLQWKRFFIHLGDVVFQNMQNREGNLGAQTFLREGLHVVWFHIRLTPCNISFNVILVGFQFFRRTEIFC